jgi:hypothetical protein
MDLEWVCVSEGKQSAAKTGAQVHEKMFYRFPTRWVVAFVVVGLFPVPFVRGNISTLLVQF